MNNIDRLMNEINIPEGIDLAVKMGIERGRKEKKVKRLFKTKKWLTYAASILAIMVTMGIVNPSIAGAIPSIKSIFNLIGYGNMGESFDKFQQFSNNVNKSVEKSGIKITLNEITVDDNTLAITSTEEGKGLKENTGYMGHITLNGKLISTRNSKDKRVDDTTIVTVTYANISDLNLPDEINVYLNIVWFSDIKGPWDFKFKVFKTDKPTNSKVINLNKSIKLPNSSLKLEKLIISPLGNTLTYSGVYNKSNNSMRNGIFDFIIMDENIKMLQSKIVGVSSTKEKYDGKIEILSDLSNVKALTVVPILKEWGLQAMTIDNLHCSILQTTINSTDFSIPQETIVKSRSVTEKEKSDGYFVDKVTHVFNIDKAREFSSLEGLVNQLIKVGDSNTVLIKSVEASEKETKITFKIQGNGLYSYSHINSVLLLDENYNDIERAEDGDTAAIENANEGIVSMNLPPIDKTKKYKIALPITDEPQIEEQYKMIIDLAN